MLRDLLTADDLEYIAAEEDVPADKMTPADILSYLFSKDRVTVDVLIAYMEERTIDSVESVKTLLRSLPKDTMILNTDRNDWWISLGSSAVREDSGFEFGIGIHAF